MCPLWMYEEVWGGYQPQTWHHGNIFTQQVNLNSQITLGPTWQLWRNEVAPIWPWDSIPMAQKLWTYLMCMCWEAVWGGYRPQTWCYDIISSEFPNLGPIWPVERYQGVPIWPWDSMPMAKTLCIRLIWMYYKVRWGGLRWISASTLCYDIIFTPQEVNLNSQILGLLGRQAEWYKGASICPWNPVYQWIKHFGCVHWVYKEVWGWFQPKSWHYGNIFTPQVNLNSQIWGQLGQCDGSIRVHPYGLETAY